MGHVLHSVQAETGSYATLSLFSSFFLSNFRDFMLLGKVVLMYMVEATPLQKGGEWAFFFLLLKLLECILERVLRLPPLC